VLLAGLLLVLKTKSATAAVIVGLTNVALIATGTTLYALVRRCRTTLAAWATVPVYLFWIASHFYYFFLVTHDVWLHMLLCTAMTVLLYRYVVLGLLSPWAWGLLGGIASLANPTLTFAWGALFVLFFVRVPSERRKWALAAAIVVFMAAPWAIRNALVFQRFIPVKSNLGYELYQANVEDADGVYTDESFLQHPYVSVEERALVARDGELAYISARQQQFRQYVRRSPLAYLKQIGTRLLAATVCFMPVNPVDAHGAASRARRLFYPVPWLLLVAALCVRGPQRPFLRALGCFLVPYLGVYAAAAFYSRYLLPLTPILLLLALLGADQLSWWVRQHRAAPATV